MRGLLEPRKHWATVTLIFKNPLCLNGQIGSVLSQVYCTLHVCLCKLEGWLVKFTFAFQSILNNALCLPSVSMANTNKGLIFVFDVEALCNSSLSAIQINWHAWLDLERKVTCIHMILFLKMHKIWFSTQWSLLHTQGI